MPATIQERTKSRPFTIGANAARELQYVILGTDDEEEVEDLLRTTAPSVYKGLVIESIIATPEEGDRAWIGTARYRRFSADAEFTFDTSGGNLHISQSLGTVAGYAPAGMTAPDFQGAIGVTDDQVVGTDIYGRGFRFTETHFFTDSQVDTAYKLTAFQLTGRFNDDTFKGFAAGECLLLGVSGQKRGDEQWALTYAFECQPNQAGMIIGGTYSSLSGPTGGVITGINKLGWDYLWVRYGDFFDEDAYALVRRPVAAYVERVYEPGDMSLLNIGA